MTTICGAKAKSTGKPCKRPAGWGTDHAGEGRCKLHGGASHGRPIIHGRYSFKHRQSLQDKVQQFLADPQPGNLTSELAVLRALFQDYMDKYPEGLPIDLKSRLYIQDLIEDVGKMVERINRMMNQTALTIRDIQYFEARLKDLVVKYIDDPNRQVAFLDELASDFGFDRIGSHRHYQITSED